MADHRQIIEKVFDVVHQRLERAEKIGLEKLNEMETRGREEIEREHPEMLESLRSIISDVLIYSEGLPPEDSRIRRRITDVLDQLLAHEKREMDLIQRAFNRDIGVGD